MPLTLDQIEKRYEEALFFYLDHIDEEALYEISEIGKLLVMSKFGPDVLHDIHSKALKKHVSCKDPAEISRIVLIANEVLLNGIMAYAMSYYTLLDALDAEKKKLEQANTRLKEMDKLKSMFIASMSHELRTPLNSIIGFSGMTLQGLSGEVNEEQKDNLTRVIKSAKHLLSLITDVIDISKIEAGRIELNTEIFELCELITEAVSSIQLQAKEKMLELIVNVPVGLAMNTDRKRLLQCILNYLSNAVKFSEAGKITILAREINGDVEISVIDTGIGIAEKDVPRLFEAFERIDTHLRIKAGGSGLGLYLTKKLATEVLHGSVVVESIEGKGSTFILRLPKILKKEG